MNSMVVKRLFIIKIALIAATLQGCSSLGIGKSDFSCPGGIDGVRCLSARQVYEATESSDYVKTRAEENQTGANANKQSVPVVAKVGSAQVAVPRIGQPVPIRTQAKVMRIWIAPWEDNDGDLHANGYIYTEIERRKWNLGQPFNSPGTALSPLSVVTPSKAAK
ncbi:MAG: type IV conjugative transfer system protein TraV [Methylovulum sp.]|nr:MAG: type IV conjugative transfer system protein TraV [Methylovulum sp.]